jgi:hypothetical protein
VAKPVAERSPTGSPTGDLSDGKAKDARDHNPRVGGWSPSSGITKWLQMTMFRGWSIGRHADWPRNGPEKEAYLGGCSRAESSAVASMCPLGSPFRGAARPTLVSLDSAGLLVGRMSALRPGRRQDPNQLPVAHRSDAPFLGRGGDLMRNWLVKKAHQTRRRVRASAIRTRRPHAS